MDYKAVIFDFDYTPVSYTHLDVYKRQVVDGGAEGALILAGEEAGEVYTLDVSALGLEEPLADGMMVEILYDGMILETWPAQFANVLAVRPAEGAAADDRCGLCLQVLADLWEVDAGLNEDITQLGVDLSGFTGLTEGEKAACLLYTSRCV